MINSVEIPRKPEERTVYVRRMFDSIAGTYDLLNTVLSLNIDALWRRKTVKLAQVPGDGKVLDLCTGTGKLAFDFARYSPAGEITGIDFSPVMIQKAQETLLRFQSKAGIQFQEGNALELPFEGDRFDAVSCAFGLRNLVDMDLYHREVYRVTKPGGKTLSLELTRPRNPLVKLIYVPYLKIYLPLMGRVVSRNPLAYDYLAKTISEFASPPEILESMRKAGWRKVRAIPFTGGIATLFYGTK